MSARIVLHPRTLDSIEAQPDSGDPRISMRSCGCIQQPSGAWWLCGYHEGFEDAVADAAASQQHEGVDIEAALVALEAKCGAAVEAATAALRHVSPYCGDDEMLDLMAHYHDALEEISEHLG